MFVRQKYGFSKESCVLAVNPLSTFDDKLIIDISKSGAFPIVDIGFVWNEQIELRLHQLAGRLQYPFGIRVGESLVLPDNFAKQFEGTIACVIFSHPNDVQNLKNIACLCDVVSVEEAQRVDQLNLSGLIVKGNESGGRVGELSSFIFMQQIAGSLKTPYWVQGGMGPHGAGAAVYSGAQGVVYDNQLALMGRLARHKTLAPILNSVNGSETEVVHGYRFLRHGLLQSLHEFASKEQLLSALQQTSPEKAIVLAGIDIALAPMFAAVYKDPQTLVYMTETAIRASLHRSDQSCFQPHSPFAEELGVDYPIIQGPMTRVSDVPDFASDIAHGGALPTIACAVLHPDKLDAILTETAAQLNGKSWAAGILAFLPMDVLQPQLDVIIKHQPRAVVLAGGRVDQCKFFSQHDIIPIVHCPTGNLFQQFLQDGVQHFIFEGRECGGHIGPLSSMTLWEMQIMHAMEFDQPDRLSLAFAGGIHDEFSAQIVSVMVRALVEQGAKVGVLMGSAYIFCEEVVSSGAVLSNFQEQVVDGQETTVVETGVGHVTRCLNTQYVDYLAEKRREMEEQGLSKEEVFVELEKLNVGHLRIASKGVRREGDHLVSVPMAEQNQDGMFMIGDVALLRHKTTTIAQLHQAVSSPALSTTKLQQARERFVQSRGDACDIAIVGMAAQFAGSQSIDEYWLNILEGKDLITEVDDQRWSKELFYDPETRAAENEKTYSKWGGFIDTFAIDPVEFGIPPQTLSSIDPGQLAALRVANDALVDAGYTDSGQHHKTSVIFGYEPGGEVAGAYGMRVFMNQVAAKHPSILEQARQHYPQLNEDSFAGILGNVLAGRVSNRLNLGGQNFSIDAACASSLAAVDAAVKELRYGESDMVIAGGGGFS